MHSIHMCKCTDFISTEMSKFRPRQSNVDDIFKFDSDSRCRLSKIFDCLTTLKFFNYVLVNYLIFHSKMNKRH